MSSEDLSPIALGAYDELLIATNGQPCVVRVNVTPIGPPVVRARDRLKRLEAENDFLVKRCHALEEIAEVPKEHRRWKDLVPESSHARPLDDVGGRA